MFCSSENAKHAATIPAIGVVTTRHLSNLIWDRYLYLSYIWEHWHSTFPHRYSVKWLGLPESNGGDS